MAQRLAGQVRGAVPGGCGSFMPCEAHMKEILRLAWVSVYP